MNIAYITEALVDLIDEETFESSSVEITYAGFVNLYNVVVYDTDGELICHQTVEIDEDEDDDEIAESIFSQLDI